ncbi:MAG: hypothetical protein AAF329_15860 [Cyanobacteria bacterium P01_A01_bin.17]
MSKKVVSEVNEEMVTPAGFQNGIQTISDNLDSLQRASEIAREIENAEILQIIRDLRINLVNTKYLLLNSEIDCEELKEKNLLLENQIKELRANVDEVDHYEVTEPEVAPASVELIKSKSGLLYRPGYGHHAFCPNCWSQNERRLSLLEKKRELPNLFKYECLSCNWYVRLLEPASNQPSMVGLNRSS